MAVSKSYANGIGNNKLVYSTFGQLLDEAARQSPLKTAHIFRKGAGEQVERKVVTFQMLATNSLKLASNLLSMGFGPGDRVAVIGRSCPEWLYLEYALLRTKMLFIRVPNIFVGPGMLQPLLKKYNCKGLVIDPGNNDEMLKKIDDLLPGIISNSETAIDRLELSIQFVFLMQPSPVGVKTLNDVMNREPVDISAVSKIQNSISPDDVALIMATSGTTGQPKLVTLTHFGVINNYRVSCEQFWDTGDPNAVYFNDRPFSWYGGHQFTPVVIGTPMVHMESASTDTIIQAIEEEKGTILVALAYALHDMKCLVESGNRLPQSLSNIVSGGELIPKELIAFCMKHFKQFSVTYGSTECLLSTFKLYAAECKQEDDYMTLFPFVEAKILENENLVPCLEPGELFLRSIYITKQFLDDVQSTSEVLDSSGWFKTGDVAKLNSMGGIQLVGRVKDVISRGAIKIYPISVENVLTKFPNVEKVAVIGLPDPRLFQEVCACVIPKLGQMFTEDQLLLYCQQVFVDASCSLIPKYVWVMNEFPLNTNGKVDKVKLIELAIEKFGLKEIK